MTRRSGPSAHHPGTLVPVHHGSLRTTLPNSPKTTGAATADVPGAAHNTSVTRRLRLLLITPVALLVGMASACGSSAPARLIGVERTPAVQVGAVELPDVTTADAGTPFGFRATPGTLLVVYFGFTNCPDLCPTTLADLRTARKRIGDAADAVDLALITVDPERDSAAIMRSYAASFATRFRVLRTTDTSALQAAEEAFLASSSVKKLPDGTVSVSHTASTYVVDSTGTVVVEWPFGIGATGMEHDLRILINRLKETSS